MKTETKTPSWAKWMLIILIVIAAIWIFCLVKCDRDKVTDQNTVVVTVPKQEGKFDAVKPQQTIVSTQPSSVLNDVNTEALSNASKQSYEKDLLIDKLLRQNDSLSKLFVNKPDSVKTSLYNDVMIIREYKHTFEDTAVKIDLSGLVRGEIQSMSCDWKVKERKLPIQVKTWRVLGGVELGAKQTLNRFAAKANIRYQSAKGNLYSVGIDNNQLIWLGYDIQIFKHTKVK